MMGAPQTTIDPKPRERLWKETLVGIVVFFVGIGIVGAYVWHQLSPAHTEHQPEVTILMVGIGAVVLGMWWMNRKLTREMVRDFMGWAMFWKKGGP